MKKSKKINEGYGRYRIIFIYVWIIFLVILLFSGLAFMNPTSPYDYSNSYGSNSKSAIGWGIVALSIILGYITRKYWWDETNRYGGGSIIS